MTDDFPVHEEVNVHDGENIYRESDWWKAALMCSIGGQSSDPSLCVYLWHKENGDWKRKSKYQAKDAETWAIDRDIIDKLRQGSADVEEGGDGTNLPVSDYYTVSQSSTVFKTENWWKAIVSVSEKGNYKPKPEEIVVYLWQNDNGGWRRRQKYTVEDPDRWETEKKVIGDLLKGGEDTAGSQRSNESLDGEAEKLIEEVKEHVDLE